eukprot:Phypoly_transcript_12598.p1 GENE.Phypoly_transcript_12598~~Phypoly_transcript_12598.p1  ORF type:complete len:120 (+),score=8.98 Phypoly_transcript_12598:120-479(+)
MDKFILLPPDTPSKFDCLYSALLDTFNFCIWLTSRLEGCFVDMRHWLQENPTTECVDETNCLFGTLADVITGTKLQLRLSGQRLGSLIGKFMGTDRLRPTWCTFSDIWSFTSHFTHWCK